MWGTFGHVVECAAPTRWGMARCRSTTQTSSFLGKTRVLFVLLHLTIPLALSCGYALFHPTHCTTTRFSLCAVLVVHRRVFELRVALRTRCQNFFIPSLARHKKIFHSHSTLEKKMLVSGMSQRMTLKDMSCYNMLLSFIEYQIKKNLVTRLNRLHMVTCANGCHASTTCPCMWVSWRVAAPSASTDHHDEDNFYPEQKFFKGFKNFFSAQKIFLVHKIFFMSSSVHMCVHAHTCWCVHTCAWHVMHMCVTVWRACASCMRMTCRHVMPRMCNSTCSFGCAHGCTCQKLARGMLGWVWRPCEAFKTAFWPPGRPKYRIYT